MSINDTSRNGSVPTTIEDRPSRCSHMSRLKLVNQPSLMEDMNLQQPSRHELTQREWKGSARASSSFSAAGWPLRFCSLCSRL